ncbi:MAG: hypothetical protein M5R40_04440 [Anaerolineae bacterium]|nr:hypothetical protein [Anaerolineae bacterium]
MRCWTCSTAPSPRGNPAEGTFTFTGSGGSAVTGQGALRFVLSWSGAADLDLVVTDPAGNQIYWDAPTSPTGGALDSSQGNDFCEVAAAQPQEVIAWEANAPTGDYTVMVQLSLACNTTGEVPLTITVEGDGGAVLDVLEGTVSEGNPAEGTFTFAGAGAPPVASEGALNFVLNWSGAADLDLIVTDPAGNQIYWDAPTSPTGGVLDSTLGNDFCEVAAAQPQEVVFWEASAPTGDYGLMVQLSLPCGTTGAVPFTIQVVDTAGAVLDTLSGEVSEGSASEGTFTYVGGGGGAAPLPAVDYGPIPTFTDGSEVPVIEPGVHIQDFIDNQNFALSGRVAGNTGDVITVTMTRVDGDLLPLVAILVEEGDVWTSLVTDQSTEGRGGGRLARTHRSGLVHHQLLASRRRQRDHQRQLRRRGDLPVGAVRPARGTRRGWRGAAHTAPLSFTCYLSQPPPVT